MGSIPKIVSTPIKWVCKRLLHATLLRFPGGNADSPLSCTYCPEMCRFACPTAVASGDDTATPCNKMALLYKERRWPGQIPPPEKLWPLYQCTGCARCSEYCVYRVSVPDQLIAARATHRWSRAVEAAARLDDGFDSWGDLADELGDLTNSARRFQTRLSGGVLAAEEGRTIYFARQRGLSVELSWGKVLGAVPAERLKAKLSGRRWLVHESVWLSRRLERAAAVQGWVERARVAGCALEVPFAHGRDCIDCGGEGAYRLIDPENSARMARNLWRRDAQRAEGILCFSRRCADHFRRTLGGEVPVVFLGDYGEEQA